MRGRFAAVVAAAALLALGLAAPAPVAAVPSPAPADVPPSQRVYVVTESVGLGARAALPLAFPADWQVTVDGTPALFVEQLESKHVRARMATTPSVFGDVAVVAGGHNYPYWDPARFDRSIDSIIGALREAGVKHILWVTLREVKPEYVTASAWREVQPYAWYFPIVNDHLEAAVARHPDLTLVDWTSAADRPGITYDAIHLNTTGAALYSQVIADTVMSTLGRLPARSTTAIPVATQPGVAAVAVNLTVAAPRSSGFLTAFPCTGSQPLVSNANFVRDQVVASAAIVPVGPDGTICVYTNEGTHLIVDVTGSFPTGAGFTSLAPSRLADTRESTPGVRHPAGTPLVVPVLGHGGVPADADAVVLTVTSTESAAGGFAAVTPCGTPPTGTSNVNFAAGATVPNLVVVAPGADGSVCVTSNVDTHLIVDVFGAFADGSSVGLVGPERLVDTRLEPLRRPGAGGGTVVVPVVARDDVPDDASGVMLNLTAAAPVVDGFLTAYPCDAGRPTASNLNTRAGTNRANFVLVAPDADGEVCVFSSGESDVVVDLLGWVGSSFAGTTPSRLLDTRAA